MSDMGALMETKRRQQVMRRKREALERLSVNCGDAAVTLQ